MNNISIVLPVTDRGAGEVYLTERVVASLVAQTEKPNQFIVVEYNTALPWPLSKAHDIFCGADVDLSLDSGSEWMYRPNVKSYAQAVQYGLAMLNGSSDSAVVIPNQEYIYDPNFIKVMSSEWRKRYNDIGILYCYEREMDSEGGEVDWTPRTPYDRMAALNGCALHLPAMALNIRRAVESNLGALLHEGVHAWDTALILGNFGVSCVPETLATHYWPAFFPTEASIQAQARHEIVARAKHNYYGPDLQGVAQNGNA
mgnify:CR=1 FL=1